MRLHTCRAHLLLLSPHNLSTQAVFREWTAHQHIHAIATGDRKQLDALPPPIMGPTEHFYLSSLLTALPSQFSSRWLLISCLSGFPYGGKQVVVEVVVRGSLIHTQNPQRTSSAPFMRWEPCYSQDTPTMFIGRIWNANLLKRVYFKLCNIFNSPVLYIFSWHTEMLMIPKWKELIFAWPTS